MDTHGNADEKNIGPLAEDVAATAAVAGAKVDEARDRLKAALDSGKELIGRVREKAGEHAKVADEVIRENRYQTIVIALVIGTVIGYLAARQCSRNDD